MRKRTYNLENQLIRSSRVHAMKTGAINNIQFLPTNIVNKLVPRKMLQIIAYYNIPFSQDQSISYQLFDKVDHFFVDEEVYLYENSTLSTSGMRKTEFQSLLRVAAIERILLKLCAANKYNAAYIKYRYELLLQSRFAYLGFVYCPSMALRAFCIHYFGLFGVFRHLYHYAISYKTSLKLWITLKYGKTASKE